jgi:hypothetical protein
MRKILFAVPIAAFVFAVAAPQAFAHGHTSFEINGNVYSFTVGSLNEPVAVDDKTGVDLRVVSMSEAAHEAGEMSEKEAVGTPATGLEKTLKVELIAGGKKKTLDLSPAYNDPGAYRAYFTPTVQTTYSYRLFGTIDNVPFDYLFTCNPAGHPQTAEDKTEVEVSKGVMRVEAAGAFGCPGPKAELGFPEPSASINDLSNKVSAADMAIVSVGVTSRNWSMLALAVGGLALVLSIGGLMKSRSGGVEIP